MTELKYFLVLIVHREYYIPVRRCLGNSQIQISEIDRHTELVYTVHCMYIAVYIMPYVA